MMCVILSSMPSFVLFFRSFALQPLRRSFAALACLLLSQPFLAAQMPDTLVADQVPPVPQELRRDVGRYLEFRSAGFCSWHPQRRDMLVATRFADSTQLHLVRRPGGARKQITFLPEPVTSGSFRPKTGEYVVFRQDTGGGEFFQYYRLDVADGRITLLTDGKSRNGGGRWSHNGCLFAYMSTRRNGHDSDLYLIDPSHPTSDHKVLELKGGGWSVSDWSHDNSSLLLLEYVSINESRLHLFQIDTGKLERVTPERSEKISYGGGLFSGDDKAVFATSDADSEYQHLVRLDLAAKTEQSLVRNAKWDVETFDITADGQLLAYVNNEDGVSVLHVVDLATGAEKPLPRLPAGTIASVDWHEDGRFLALTLSSAQSPTDVFSIDIKSGKLERWTESETGGLDASSFVESQLVRVKSFDGVEFSAFVYRPDPKKFPGPRPAIVSIHGGPESQSRPGFLGRGNYYLNEMGIALVLPNVRGSSGYGKSFLLLDNGNRREDSVADIGALLDFLRQDPGIASDRIAVMGGSYGGYMTLASLTHYSDKLRCGVDVVGISNFVTFLKNTQDYRRDLRRVEYGDERDPAMAEYLQRISPANNSEKIKVPLFVVQGKNDPRVPVTEAEQMVAALRARGGAVWYLMAKDEGHGFAKKKNADYQFYSTVLFFRQFLLN